MTPKEIKKLEKLLLYVLSRRPDEFGLFPDARGYIKLKTLLQALHEEPGWKHIRQTHINSVLLMRRPAAFEFDANGLRAHQRDQMPSVEIPDKLPKLLYTTVRRRAHRSVFDNGIYPGALPYIQLSSDIAMAERVGRRTDSEPVLLTVQTANAIESGTSFRKFGDQLYLADFISQGTFSGPPLPKEQPDTTTLRPKQTSQRNETPGSYFPDLHPLDDKQAKKQKQRQGKADWKKQRRLARKEKARHRSE